MSAPVADLALRRAVIATALRMNAEGLNQGKSGNVSARTASGFLVTPTGMAYDALTAADLVEVGFDGTVAAGQRTPSSEWPLHQAVYVARPDARAIVHAHPLYCTSLACARRAIPPFHYMVAVAGGRDVRCAPYATYGTDELGHHAVTALEGRFACLLANHGLVALGRNLEHAFTVAREVETLAAQYWHALQVGEPVLLPDDEMARVVEKFRTYGQQRA